MSESASEPQEDLSAARKAAIVLAALGKDLASEVCSALPVDVVLHLAEELSRLSFVSSEELQKTLQEFLQRMRAAAPLGGPMYAKSLLESTLGYSQIPEVDLAVRSALSRLNEVEATALYRCLREERPQTIAAILPHLSAARAAQLLSYFDEREAAEIAYRAAHLASPSPGAIQALVEALHLEVRRAGGSYAESTPEVSTEFVANLIGSMSPERAKTLLEALREMDPEFGEGVAEQVFTFEDLPRLADSDLQILLREVPMEVLVMALKGTPQEWRERLKQNLSQRGRERLEEEMAMLGPVPVTQVQEAQRQICQRARELAESGQISLEGGTVQYVE